LQAKDRKSLKGDSTTGWQANGVLHPLVVTDKEVKARREQVTIFQYFE